MGNGSSLSLSNLLYLAIRQMLKIWSYLQPALSIPQGVFVLQSIAPSSLVSLILAPLKSQRSHFFSAINFFKLTSSNGEAGTDTLIAKTNRMLIASNFLKYIIR